jgi:hypothetical protein
MTIGATSPFDRIFVKDRKPPVAAVHRWAQHLCAQVQVSPN